MDDVLLDDLVGDLAGNDAWKTEPRDHEGKWTNKAGGLAADVHLILQGGDPHEWNGVHEPDVGDLRRR